MTIPEGVLSAKSFPELWDDIAENGKNLEYAELMANAKAALEAVVQMFPLQVPSEYMSIPDTVAAELLGGCPTLETHTLELVDAEATYHLVRVAADIRITVKQSRWACRAARCWGGTVDLNRPSETGQLGLCPPPEEWVAAWRNNRELRVPIWLFPVIDGGAEERDAFDLWRELGLTTYFY
jgi:hypothetical protein